MAAINKWLSQGDYLPKPLRDFHKQKKVFKMIDELMSRRVANYKCDHGFEPPEVVVNWVAGHIYVIDVFLWFMAKHGYTLQKMRSRKDSPLEFSDLSEAIKTFDERRTELSRSIK